MTKNIDKEGLRSIVNNYDIFYIDLWGVVHNGITLHKNAIKTLEQISKVKKDYVLLTNAPRPSRTVKSFLEKILLENFHFLIHALLLHLQVQCLVDGLIIVNWTKKWFLMM